MQLTKCADFPPYSPKWRSSGTPHPLLPSPLGRLSRREYRCVRDEGSEDTKHTRSAAYTLRFTLSTNRSERYTRPAIPPNPALRTCHVTRGPARRCSPSRRSRDTDAASDWMEWLVASAAVHGKVGRSLAAGRDGRHHRRRRRQSWSLR